MSQRQFDKKDHRKPTYAMLLFAVLAVGVFSTVGFRTSYAQEAPIYGQYIMQELPAIQPIVTRALSPTGNASLPADLSDIVSSGQQLASKEFTASNNAISSNHTTLATRYASSGIDIYRHLLNLVTQYEYDNHAPKQAKVSEQASDLLGQITRIQWQEVRVYEIRKSADKFNQTIPAQLSNVTTLISNAKQDVQNVISAENGNASNFSTIEKSLVDGNKDLTKADKILNQMWRDQEKNIDQIQGHTRIDKIIAKLTTMANTLQQKAQNQSNAESQGEITIALTDIQQAQNSANTDDFRTAIHFLRDASIHLKTAEALLQE